MVIGRGREGRGSSDEMVREEPRRGSSTSMREVPEDVVVVEGSEVVLEGSEVGRREIPGGVGGTEEGSGVVGREIPGAVIVTMGTPCLMGAWIIIVPSLSRR